MIKIFRILLIIIFSSLVFFSHAVANEKKIKIGLLVPLTGDNAKLGKQVVKATRLAIKDMNTNQIEIYPKDTQSDPNITLQSAMELDSEGVNLIIGPIFYKNLIYLNEVWQPSHLIL